jgi:hypothetical protein
VTDRDDGCFHSARELAEWLIGKDAGAADMAMAEAVAETAISITHECGTPEATGKAVGSTIAGFLCRVMTRHLPRRPHDRP